MCKPRASETHVGQSIGRLEVALAKVDESRKKLILLDKLLTKLKADLEVLVSRFVNILEVIEAVPVPGTFLIRRKRSVVD